MTKRTTATSDTLAYWNMRPDSCRPRAPAKALTDSQSSGARALSSRWNLLACTVRRFSFRRRHNLSGCHWYNTWVPLVFQDVWTLLEHTHRRPGGEARGKPYVLGNVRLVRLSPLSLPLSPFPSLFPSFSALDQNKPTYIWGLSFPHGRFLALALSLVIFCYI